MTATITEARDEITQQLVDRWDVETPPLNGGEIIPLAFEEIDFDKPDGPWALLTIRHTGSRTATFVEQGQARHNNTGVVIVSVYQPWNSGVDTTLAEAMAEIARAAYQGQGTPSQVEFTDVTPLEVGVSSDENGGGPWYQINVTASFNYDNLAPSPPP